MNIRDPQEQLQACEASGKSVSAYASEQDLPVRVMYDAKKVLVKKGVSPRTQRNRIQRVQTATVTAETRWRIRLRVTQNRFEEQSHILRI